MKTRKKIKDGRAHPPSYPDTSLTDTDRCPRPNYSNQGLFKPGERRCADVQGSRILPPHLRAGRYFHHVECCAAAATTTTNTASSTTESNTTGESSTTTTIYKPFRVQFDTRQLAQQMDLAISAGDAIAATKLYLLIYEILPMIAQFWGDILRLIPVTGGIYPLAAQGSGVDHFLSNGQSNENALSPILPGVVFSLRE